MLFRSALFALIAGVVLSSFTVQKPHESKSVDALHFFYIVDNAVGDYIGDYDLNFEEDRLQLEIDTGCTNLSTICAEGFETMNPTIPGTGNDEWLQN